MFTGIIESIGKVLLRIDEGSNIHFQIRSSISHEFEVDNSVSHQGVCLTITKVENDTHWVTAVDETLKRSNLDDLKTGSHVNLERALAFNGRIEGHLVQGHVDTTATCKKIEDVKGSHQFTFELSSPSRLLVDKGSVCINGVSLTVIEPTDTKFSVAIIPYTFDNTTFNELKVGDKVNIEFDIIGKYVQRMLK